MNFKSDILKLRELYSNITFEDFVINRDMFKKEYDKVMANGEVKVWLNYIYSLKTSEKKKERMWEYLNNDINAKDLLDSLYRGFYRK